jgi:hypothetical protein
LALNGSLCKAALESIVVRHCGSSLWFVIVTGSTADVRQPLQGGTSQHCGLLLCWQQVLHASQGNDNDEHAAARMMPHLPVP